MKFEIGDVGPPVYKREETRNPETVFHEINLTPSEELFYLK